MDTTINLRIDAAFKSELADLAAKRDLKLAPFIREVLDEYVENHLENQGFQSANDLKDSNTHSEHSLNQNLQGYKDPDANVNFLQMILWIHDRKTQPYFNNSNQFLLSIKRQVEMAIMESPFSPQLKMEFMKIQTDITRVLHEPEGYNRKFTFSLCDFNYELLNKELKNL